MDLTKYNSKDMIEKLVSDIVNARRENSLVCVIGAGVSISQGYPDWNHYVLELINYWSSNLQNLVKKPETLATKVERTDILFLESLNSSAQSNKRKVDFVNFIVKKYCDTGDPEKTEIIYQNCYLECEKFIFSETEPLFHENATLNELVKLNAAFLTTNYDEEIENAYQSILGRNPQVIPDAYSINGHLTSKMVIHLHGLPSENSSRVISSSKSYTDLYLKPNDVGKRIKEFFSGKKNPTIIYVGCSMEEDEVLTLLEFNGLNVNHYALMKYDDSSQVRQENEAHNSIIRSYYSKEQNVQFIWYGNHYSDLAGFSAELAKSVHTSELSFLPNPDELERVLLSDRSKTDFLESLDGALRTESYYVVNSIFEKYADLSKELEVRNIGYTSDSLLFKKHIVASSMFIDYWKCVERVFSFLGSDFREKIISEIKEMREWDTETVKVLFEIVLQYVDKNSASRVEQLNEILGKFLNREYFDDNITNQDIRCLWLCHQVKHSQQVFVTDIYSDKIAFDFNQNTLPYFEEALNSLQERASYMSFSSLLENTVVKSLDQLIQAEKLTYEGQRIFPDSFYKNILIQRILMNLDLQNNLDSEVLECVQKNLNVEDRNLGSNVIKFARKHDISINNSFRYIDDDYKVSMMNPVREQAFFNVQPIENTQQVDELIQNLTETPHEKSVSVGTNFVDIGVKGQCEELESVLNTEEQWKKYKAQNFDFLRKLIGNEDLLKKYISVVVNMMHSALENGYDAKDVSEVLLRKLPQTGLPMFTVSNEDLFSTMIQQADENKESVIYQLLFNEVDPMTLAKPSKLRDTDFIDLASFINSESGIYYSLIKKIEAHSKNVITGTYKSELLKGIDQQDEEYRCYLKGMFAMICEGDPEIISRSGFVGFSHNYQLNLNKKWPDKFKNVVSDLLNSQIDNNEVVVNTTMTMLVSLRPEDYEKSESSRSVNNIKSAVLRQLIDFFIKRKDAVEYNTSEWIQWFIENYSESVNTVISNLLRELANITVSRGEQLLNIINMGDIPTDEKINTYTFSYIPDFDKLGREHLALIGDCLKVVFAKNLLSINASTINQITKILSKLSSKGLNANIFAILNAAEHVLPPDDITSLRKDFNYKDDNH
ncbi:SIR2 family protein [Levilactobacillus spicheri]|uniref:SIR2 family protein n=1 Tax=Levilactobacillus spicheri TaxID=216463 RepID=UPI00069B409F|nr:SIR2 family protein [Levilactobacillus spicheri]